MITATWYLRNMITTEYNALQSFLDIATSSKAITTDLYSIERAKQVQGEMFL